MIKEFLHICRTYSVTFRYLKKNECYVFLFLVYAYIIVYLFF